MGKRHCDGPISHGSWRAPSGGLLHQVRADFTGELILGGKVAFEEHFAIEDTLEQSRSFAGDSGVWDDFTRQLLDLDSERLGHMDATGIEFALLSLNAPGVQRITDPKEALQIAKKANEAMAE